MIVQSSAKIDTGWHHLVASYDNQTARIYVDGILQGMKNPSGQVNLTPTWPPQQQLDLPRRDERAIRAFALKASNCEAATRG